MSCVGVLARSFCAFMQTEERYHAGELHGQLCRAFAGCPKTLLDGNHSDVRPHPAVLFMQQQTQPARAEIYPARHLASYLSRTDRSAGSMLKHRMYVCPGGPVSPIQPFGGSSGSVVLTAAWRFLKLFNTPPRGRYCCIAEGGLTGWFCEH